MSEAVNARGIFLFALRVLGWSVALFALWFLAARPLSLGVAWGAGALLRAGAPVERTHERWKAPQVVFDVELDGAATYRSQLRTDAIFEVAANPLKQTFGLPFFLALLFASRASRLAINAVLGGALLLALAALGVACEVAINLGALTNPGGGALVPFNSTQATLAALGFQLGTLILPTVVPVMLWTAMDPRYIGAMARAQASK